MQVPPRTSMDPEADGSSKPLDSMDMVQLVRLRATLQDDLDTAAMRVKEHFGWHFPELSRLVTDNVQYLRVVAAIKSRNGVSVAALEDIVSKEVAAQVAAAAEASMGLDLGAEDLDAIARRTAQAVEAGSLLERLDGYLREKMATVAPNLAALIGAGESGGATAAAAAPPVTAHTAPPLADGEPEELEAPPPPPAPQQE